MDADTLAAFQSLPQARCHELKADRKGQLAVRLDKGFRIAFEVANQTIPLKPDGGLDWNQATCISSCTARKKFLLSAMSRTTKMNSRPNRFQRWGLSINPKERNVSA